MGRVIGKTVPTVVSVTGCRLSVGGLINKLCQGNSSCQQAAEILSETQGVVNDPLGIDVRERGQRLVLRVGFLGGFNTGFALEAHKPDCQIPNPRANPL